jgi:hypothetical protein
MDNIRVLALCQRLWYNTFGVHMYFLGIYEYHNFTHERYTRCVFGNLEVAK